jgi:chromosome segregation ATPase
MEAEMDRLNTQMEQSRATGFDTKKLNKDLEFQNSEIGRQIEDTLQDMTEKDQEISSLRKVLDNYQDQNLDYKEDNKVLGNDV